MATARLDELKSKFDENPRRFFAPYANELRKTGDATQAIAICRTHLAGQPGHVSGHIVLAQALHEAGEMPEARAEFETALELDPENLIALRFMGDISRAAGEATAARGWYERVLDADPRNDEIAQILRELPAVPNDFAPPTAPAAAHQVTPVVTPAIEDETAEAAFSAQGAWTVDAESEAPSPEAPATSHDADAMPVAEEAMDAPHLMEWSGDFATPAAEAKPEAMEPTPPAPTGMLFTPVAVSDESFEPFGFAANEMAESELVEDVHEAPAAGETVELAAAGEQAYAEAHLKADGKAGEEEDDETAPESSAEEEIELPSWNDGRSSWHRPTPAAVHSDYEAAPEDWFPETKAPEDAPAAPESAARASEPDDWFPDTVTASRQPEQDATDEEVVAASAEAAGTDDIADLFDDPSAAEAAAAEIPEASSGDWEAAISAEAPADVEAHEDHAAEFAEMSAESANTEPDASAERAHTEQADDHRDWFAEEAAQAAAQEPFEVHAAAPGVAGEVPAERIEGLLSSETVRPADATPMPDVIPGYGAEFNETAAEAAAEVANPALGHTPRFTDAVTEPPAQAPFVTETLAELYLQQGFKDEALSIYRQLSDRDPSDLSLIRRIEAIESGAQSDVVPGIMAPAHHGSELASVSVRHFFSRLARREANRPPQPSPSGPRGLSGSGESFAPLGSMGNRSRDVDAMPADFAPPPRTDLHEPPSGGSGLAQLFAASAPSAADSAAATVLASGWSGPGGQALPDGRPSRVAEQELSLDHLFRDVPSGSSGGTTLDDFYAAPSSSAPTQPDGGVEQQAAEELGADIRQFTAWLEGLKKK